jgi:hypothetical protein
VVPGALCWAAHACLSRSGCWRSWLCSLRVETIIAGEVGLPRGWYWMLLPQVAFAGGRL